MKFPSFELFNSKIPNKFKKIKNTIDEDNGIFNCILYGKLEGFESEALNLTIKKF